MSELAQFLMDVGIGFLVGYWLGSRDKEEEDKPAGEDGA